MSCLSCKTNRYLVNIHKRQQRVRFPSHFQSPTAHHRSHPTHSPELRIVKRSPSQMRTFGGSISSWVCRKASQNLARQVSARLEFARYLEDGTWNTAQSNDGLGSTAGAWEESSHTGRRRGQSDGAEPLHLAHSQSHQPIPGRVQLLVSESSQRTVVSNCLRLFSWCRLTADSLF